MRGVNTLVGEGGEGVGEVSGRRPEVISFR